jgi:hypothetical protein
MSQREDELLRALDLTETALRGANRRIVDLAADVSRMRDALERIKALKDGSKGSDMGRVAGYRVCGKIAEEAPLMTYIQP